MYADEYEKEEEQYNDYLDVDTYSISEVSSVNTYDKNKKKKYEDAKKADPGYHKLKRYVNTKTGIKRESYELYTTSCDTGAIIRNAVTGVRFNKFRVGSRAESQFFKTRLVTGETGRDGETLYFDSPEEYEKHMRITVPPEIKEKWLEKRMYDLRRE
uniref:Uncharacterized protein n=1 Tax=viral metagenome TaxID=1070528 RepID=A0A6C0E8G1_9ZZZZ